MLKKIFKAMWYGVKSFYKKEENRDLFLIFGTWFLPVIISGIIGKCFIKDNDLLLLLFIITVTVIVNVVVFSYLHYKRAEECAEKNNISIEEAWKFTYEDDGMV